MHTESLETKVAVLRTRQDHLQEEVKELVAVVKANNEIISRSKGIVFGASIVVTGVWAAAFAVWKSFT